VTLLQREEDDDDTSNSSSDSSSSSESSSSDSDGNRKKLPRRRVQAAKGPALMTKEQMLEIASSPFYDKSYHSYYLLASNCYLQVFEDSGFYTALLPCCTVDDWNTHFHRLQIWIWFNLGQAHCVASRAPTLDYWQEISITERRKFVMQGFS
jgi:hypothetical protein